MTTDRCMYSHKLPQPRYGTFSSPQKAPLCPSDQSLPPSPSPREPPSTFFHYSLHFPDFCLSWNTGCINLCVWLLWYSIMPLRFVHVVLQISLLLSIAECYPIIRIITIYLYIHQVMAIWVVSIIWLFCTMLLWTFVYKSFCGQILWTNTWEWDFWVVCQVYF